MASTESLPRAGAVQEKTGLALDKELEKTGRYDHRCNVCNKAMARGAGDHLKSKGHWQLGCIRMGFWQVLLII